MKKHLIKYQTAIIALSVLAFGCNNKVAINEKNVSDFFDISLMSVCQKEAKPLKGSATDGSIVQIKILKLGDREVGSISLSVEDPQLGLLSLTPEGKPSSVVRDEHPTLKSNGSASYYEYYYHAPTVFPTSLSSDSIAAANVNMVVHIDNKPIALTRPIELIRTPIVFAHGLASDSNTFAPMMDMMLPKNLYKRRALYSLDYSATNIDTYKTNEKVIEAAIDHLKNQLFNDGYTACKVNVVGHSMGGILTRLYMQSGRYRNDIEKVVTIDTPHSGSQGADLLIDLSERFPETVFGIFGSWGAIRDLQVDSKATLEDLNGASLNLVKLPSHAICATFGGTKQVAELIKEKQYVEAILVFGLGRFAERVYGEENDIVVALSSQIGGIKKTAYSTYSGPWHCSIHTTQQTTDKVVELLEKPSTAINFSSEGFAPPTLQYTSILDDVQIEYVGQADTATDTFVVPNQVTQAVVFATDKEGKIIDAQYCDSELKYTKELNGVAKLHLVAYAADTQDVLCSSIVVR